MAIKMMKIMEEKEEELMSGVSYKFSDEGEEEQEAGEDGNLTMEEAIANEDMDGIIGDNDEIADDENSKGKVNDEYGDKEQVTEDDESLKE